MGVPRMQFRSAFLINVGLGAGNSGDDLAMGALWRHLSPEVSLHIGVFENYRLWRAAVPDPHKCYVSRGGRIENDWVRDMPGLLAGTGCIFDRQESGWPLGFLAPRIQHFFDYGLPVDAVGVSAEPLATVEGRRIFERHFLPVRSWTVRDSASIEVLQDLGVDRDRIALGGDWAWLYEPDSGDDEWAEELWKSLGVDAGRPLVAVGVYWPPSCDGEALAGALAEALDQLHENDLVQVAFVNFDFRHPGFHRSLAEQVQARMSAPSVLVPNEFYAPGQWIALLRRAGAVIARCYLLGVAGVLAGSVPVFLAERPRGVELCEELGLTACGAMNAIDVEELLAEVRRALAGRSEIVRTLAEKRSSLAARAAENLSFFSYFNGLGGAASRSPVAMLPAEEKYR